MQSETAPSPSPSHSQTFKYPECPKGQDHTGESLNLVCLQPKCIQNSVICGICLNESHKNHKIKPLKLVINSSRKYLEHLTPLNIDSTEIKNQVNEQKKNILAKYDELQKMIVETLAGVKENINAVYVKISQKIDLKTGSKDELIKTLDEVKEQELHHEKFITLMKKLLAGVPMDSQQDEGDANPAEIKSTIANISKRIQKNIESRTQVFKKQMQVLTKMLKNLSVNPGLFDTKLQFRFSTQLKHNGIEVVNENTVKSIQAYNYHFGLMEPSVSEKGPKNINVSFLIKQNTSSWVAIGLCYKNTVVQNGYQFNYSTLGHGGYLISANGGSWSSIDSAKNNVVTSFHFVKNDVIIVNYIPDDKKVVFTKKGTTESHTLEIQEKPEDELYLCCLFYYNTDEIEYLGPTEEA